MMSANVNPLLPTVFKNTEKYGSINCPKISVPTKKRMTLVKIKIKSESKK
jgi:hypothetical protein